jgi:carboxyl-terminal processing protease
MSNRFRIGLISVLVAAISLFSIGCDLPFFSTATPKTGTGLVDEAWGIISKEYVEPDKVDATALDRAAVKAMVDALNDPYTAYLDPEEYQLNITHQQGSFGGIGATVGLREGKIIVVAPIPGTPAAKAGVRSGDAILAVNGESIAGLSVEEVVMKIRGEEGTKVRVTIQHENETTPIELELTRAIIDVPSVSYELRQGMALIQIFYFSERTDEELVPILQQIKQDKAAGIIIDLRSNPGGPVDTVVNIASDFLDSGMVMYLVDNKGNETSYPVEKSSVNITYLPMVILTDNYSASGSEVLSGALQDHQRAVVAGKVTYGKGSADRWFELSDGSAIYLTVSRWLTPNRRLIERKGIDPDYPSDLEGDDLVQWAIDYLKNSGR